jgi:Domain of unknown function (DUF4402)
MFSTKHAVLVALGVVAGAVSLNAQNNASINVTAAVQQPITVTAGNALAFGNVFPGKAATVAVASASAGTFTVAGQASTPVSMTFVLPTNLTSGANNLPIGTWTGNWNTSNAPTGTSFTPAVTASAATLSATGQMFVFLGATVTPAVAQVAGSYTGTVSMTVTY